MSAMMDPASLTPPKLPDDNADENTGDTDLQRYFHGSMPLRVRETITSQNSCLDLGQIGST